MISVIIPANNEEHFIAGCLDALLQQTQASGAMEVIVVANGCTDATAEVARGHVPKFEARGWSLTVLNMKQGSKVAALNAGDAAANGQIRAYLDADIVCDPELFGQLRQVLEHREALYATGALALRPTSSWISAAYGRFWKGLPFVESGAVGAGMYAVNTAGRARWNEFPDIIADDTFARLHFAANERIEVQALYYWTLVEGFLNLVKVRRRQDQGMKQFSDRFPELMINENKSPVTLSGICRRALADPLGFIIYCAVAVAVRLGKQSSTWVRGR